MKKVVQQPLEVVQQGTTHDCVVECGGSQEDSQQDFPCVVGEHGSALVLPREFVISSPTPSLIELPIQHHKEEHAVTFLLEVKPQACECIAERKKRINIKHL